MWVSIRVAAVLLVTLPGGHQLLLAQEGKADDKAVAPRVVGQARAALRKALDSRPTPPDVQDVTPNVAPSEVQLLGGQTYEVGVSDGEIVDKSRDRKILYRWRYPKDFSGKAALVIVSHGGYGSEVGHRALGYLGSTYAKFGFVALNITHNVSANEQAHRFDRPTDVTFIIDTILAGFFPNEAKDISLLPPTEFTGKLDMNHIGHVGHSFGAFTAHAVAGAEMAPTMGIRNFRDPRIGAIVPISPQGTERFGFYDTGTENSWQNITIPVYLICGEREDPSWRREPFDRYPAVGDKFLTIGAAQGHAGMAGLSPDTVKATMGLNTALFFHVYLRGGQGRDKIGTLAHVEGWTLERKLDPRTSK